jgi:ribosomal protein L16 Arg81 hydroxylase
VKKSLLILIFSFVSSFTLFAQDAPDDAQQGGKLMERMQQYIQNRLNLSKTESEKFSPIFLRYVSELRRTHRENKQDPVLRESRVADVRLRFRNEFRQVLDEKRANRVFAHQKEFEKIVIDEMKNRMLENRKNGGGRRLRMMSKD